MKALHGLQNGSIVKVLWEMVVGSSSERNTSQWFTATVCELKRTGTVEVPLLTCKLSYQPQYDFPHTLQRVEVVRSGTFMDLATKQMFGWVHHDAETLDDDATNGEDDCGIGDNAARDDDNNDKSYVPDHPDYYRPLRGSERNFELLRLRLEKVEKEVSEQRQLLRSMDGGAHARSVTDTVHRPLLFLREKLESLFAKPIQHTSGKRPNSAHSLPRMHQGYLKCSVDCTLQEFDSICAVVKNNTACRASFDPIFNERFLPDTNCAQLSIMFDSIKELCAAVGDISNRNLKDIVIKKKARKSSKAGKKQLGKKQTGHFRIFGRLEQNRERRTDPAFITVGGSYNSASASLMERNISVLYRESNTWNAAEKRFEHPLQVVELNRERLKALLMSQELTSGETPIQDESESRLMFSLQWRCTSKPSAPTFFMSKHRREDVVGTLQAILPYVVLQGKQVCKEAERLCKHSNLTSLMN